LSSVASRYLVRHAEKQVGRKEAMEGAETEEVAVGVAVAVGGGGGGEPAYSSR
jgi:hypothetical protein